MSDVRSRCQRWTNSPAAKTILQVCWFNFIRMTVQTKNMGCLSYSHSLYSAQSYVLDLTSKLHYITSYSPQVTTAVLLIVLGWTSCWSVLGEQCLPGSNIFGRMKIFLYLDPGKKQIVLRTISSLNLFFR